jgi:subtilisin family serine protease
MPHALHNTRPDSASQRAEPQNGQPTALARVRTTLSRASVLALAAALLAVAAILAQPGSSASANPLLQVATVIVGLPTAEATSAIIDAGGGANVVVGVAGATPTGLSDQHLLLIGDAAEVSAVDSSTPTPAPVPTFPAGQVALRLHYPEPLPAMAPDESRLGVYYSAGEAGPWTLLTCAAGSCTQDTAANTFLFDITATGYYVVAAPEVTSITISPNPAKPLRGGDVQFTAQVLDYAGQVVVGPTVTWEAAATAGTISAGGLFHTTGAIGTYANAVTARYLSVSGSATVDVQHFRAFAPLAMRSWSARVTPNDAYYASLQANMAQIQAPMAWSVTRGGGGPIVAVIDSGIDLDHPDLIANLVSGWDFVNNDASADDDQGHGTHVAGIIGAVGNNGIAVAGVNWTARLMPVKVLNANGAGDQATVALGIRWAVDNGARVINLSLGASIPAGGSLPALESAVAYAISKGCVVAAASGNVSATLPKGTVMYPAAYPGVIGVGAVDRNNAIADFSNTGAFLDVVAPGASILSTYRGGGVTFMSGTSMATPHVAGLAGLILAARPSLSGDQVRAALINTATDLGPAGWDQQYGYGIINAYRALATAGQSSGTALDEPEVAPSGQSEPPVLEAGTYNPGVLWVRLQSGLSAAAVLGADGTLTGMAEDANLPDLVKVSVAPGTEAEAMQHLLATPGVDAVYPDYILFAQ